MSEFMSLLDTQDITETFVELDDFIRIPIGKNIKQLNQIGSEIKLMMNFSDRFDRKIMHQIDLIILDYKTFHLIIQESIIDHKKKGNTIFVPNEEISVLQQEIEKLSADLLDDMQVYLKAEWNRVKYESKGEIYEKETQLFDLEELMKKKSNPNYKNDVWKRFSINTKARFKRILQSHRVLIIIFVLGIVVLVLCA